MISSEPFIRFVYWIGGAVCHQLPERSILVGGRPLPFCARCTGIYISVFVSILLVLITHTKPRDAYIANGGRAFIRWGILAALLMAPLEIDGLGNWLGLWRSEGFIRTLTGSAMGLGWAVIFLSVKGYELETARFTRPASAREWVAAGAASLLCVLLLYSGGFTYIRILCVVLLVGLVAAPFALFYLLFSKLAGKSGRAWLLASAGASLGLLMVLRLLKQAIWHL